MNKEFLHEYGVLVTCLPLLVIASGIVVYYQVKPHQVTQNPEAKAVSLYSVKNYDAAIDQVDQNIAAEPGNADHYNFKANILRDKQDYNGAADYYEKAIQLNPGLLQAYINEASMYGNLGQKDKARAVVDAGLARFSNQNTLKDIARDL